MQLEARKWIILAVMPGDEILMCICQQVANLASHWLVAEKKGWEKGEVKKGR